MNFLLKKKFIFVFLWGIFFYGFLILGGAKVNASGFIYYDRYCIAKNKDVLFAPSSRADTSIKWYSSNTWAVTVSEYGIIHAQNEGESEITAVESNGNVSKCNVVVIGEDPIRIAYPSNSIVGVNNDLKLVAITPQYVESVKFEIDGPGGRFDAVATDKYPSGNVFVWSKNISIGSTGTANIKTYANTGGNWHTRDEGNFSVRVIGAFDKNSSSLQERDVSKDGANFIASCEGFVNHVYTDAAGFLTIGYGKKINQYEQFYNNTVYDEGLAVFIKLLNQGSYVRSVNNFLRNNGIKYNQHQFDALVSFCYNLGCEWLKGSDLSRILKNCGSGSGGYYTGRVNSDNGLNVRSGAGTGFRRICALPDGTVVDVLNDGNQIDGWYKIRTNGGTEGFCCGDYLNVTSSGGGSDRSLDNIDRNAFANELLCYHHASKRCLAGLVYRRFQELDMFFYNSYTPFRRGQMNYGHFAIPECARNNCQLTDSNLLWP